MPTSTISPYDLARIALLDKALLTDEDRGLLAALRRMTSDTHITARIDFLLEEE